MKHQAQELQQALQKILRGFGRQCRGQGKVFVKLGRQTERQLLDLGGSMETWAQEAQELLAPDTHLREAQRTRLLRDLETASAAYRHIAKQSQRLTQSKKLGQCKIVNAYDPTIAPIIKGTSNGPAQFGRKPGILSEPTAGFIFAVCLPLGNPSDAGYVWPGIDKVQNAIQRLRGPQRLSIHSLVCACGYSRPVVESHIACLRARGAGEIRYKGPHGAVVQCGMTVMAHNAAALVRIRQQRLSKRAQKFRRLRGLRHRNANQINDSKN